MNKNQNVLNEKDIEKVLIKAIFYNPLNIELQNSFPTRIKDSITKNIESLNNIENKYLQFNYHFLKDSEGVNNAIYFIQLLNNDTLNNNNNNNNNNLNNKCNNNTEINNFVLKVRTNPKRGKKLKTLNEVTIMKFMFENNICPVPKIYDFDIECDFIGYEYILMENLCFKNSNGIANQNVVVPLSSIYKTLNFEDKDIIMKKLRDYFVKVRNLKLNVKSYKDCDNNVIVDDNNSDCKESNILNDRNNNCDKSITYLGGSFKFMKMNDNGIVDIILNPNSEIVQGPFTSMNQYLRTLIEFYFEESFKQEERFSKYIPLLQNYLNFYFPNKKENNNLTNYKNNNEMNNTKINDKEHVMICHNDLNTSNILINKETKEIIGIIDWEFSTLSVIEEEVKCWDDLENYNYYLSLMKPYFSLNSDLIFKGFELFSIGLSFYKYKQWFGDAVEKAELFIVKQMSKLDNLLQNNYSPLFH
ncbi:hypothetical protein ABK040_007262 [Willaertia magna]